ncbi:FAD-dependent oxidoreductase [Adlercreutzia sp. R25]|uniref:FAD-dependent oxidoreductase n=1 Tax=Adlercreutzia shanghongiae TaxID=3111773 RepID=UPI002DBA2637|nr:FAD-dependent oxidoreductase [Adlercreutzia sp. R25]MEC4273690.1 FAD-dependent oxidoreductase [Adlercreutzia sp. R25]
MGKINRRQLIVGSAAAVAAIALSSCSPSNGHGKGSAEAPSAAAEGVIPGTHAGTAQGCGGPVTAQVDISPNGAIQSIVFEQNFETPGFAVPAMEQVASHILSGQTLNVDIVTGATYSSRAALDAVGNALEEAGVRQRFESAPTFQPATSPIEDLSADVAIVGGGVAGLMCAITAARDGLSVALLEKTPNLGGSMLRCDSTWLCAGGMKDGLRLGGEAWVPYYDYSTPISNREYIRIGEAMNDLLDMGVLFVPYEDDPFAPIYMDASRLAAPRWREGNAQVAARMAQAAREAGVQIFTSVAATSLITDASNTVIGITAEQDDGHEFTVQAKNVVLATGNYTNNLEALQKYLPDFANVVNSFCNGDTGDHLEWVEELGGTFHSMDVAPSMLSLEKSGRNIPFFTCFYSIVVDKSGRRFVSEGDGSYADYGFVPKTAALHSPEDSTHYYIMDKNGWDLYPARLELVDLVEKGYATKHDTLSDIIETYELAELAEEVAHYNQMVATGEDTDFGRLLNFMHFSEEGPYYVIETKPGMIMNYGGVVVNRDFAVTDSAGAPIPGLYAIGQTVGATPLMEGMDSLNGGVGPFTASGWILGHQLAGTYVGGTYTAAAQTNAGELQVRVTVEDDTRRVAAIDFPVRQEADTAVLDDLAREVIESQSMPATSEPADIVAAFNEALSVGLQKADTYFEFTNGTK